VAQATQEGEKAPAAGRKVCAPPAPKKLMLIPGEFLKF
jgi:hypothetical protein